MGLTEMPSEWDGMATDVDEAPGGAVAVAPRSPEEVASVLRRASAENLVVQVWGGGTHSGFGSPPPPDVVLSTRALDGVESWEPDDLTLVVGAGAQVSEIESMLAERAQTAVLPERPGAATVGGVVAAGVSGLRRGRLYGTRERVLEVTLVTGDGRVVRAGGRVVKNVTGYDLPRLAVGAFGSLGVVVSVCLKLWPVPPGAATVDLGSLDEVSGVSRPLAVLEEPDRLRMYLWGTEEEVAAQAKRLGGQVTEGHDWPEDPRGPYRWSLRVPPARTADAVKRLPVGWRFLAVHGVGEVRAASDDAEGVAELRRWAEGQGGHLVVTESPGEISGFDPWGSDPPALDVQRRIIAQFDPARVINPGRLPGGL